jgi:hypothetical protein
LRFDHDLHDRESILKAGIKRFHTFGVVDIAEWRMTNVIANYKLIHRRKNPLALDVFKNFACEGFILRGHQKPP